MKILFIRHADPCRESFSITEKGRKEAYLLGMYLKKYKIDQLLSGTSTRTAETTSVIKSCCNISRIRYESWLDEFKFEIVLPNGKIQYPWEMPIEYWCNDEMLSFNNCMYSEIYKSGNIKEHAEFIWNKLDILLGDYGYKRIDNYYNVKKANNKCIVIVSHFATISVMLSRLLNISLPIMLNSFWQAPSSYTSLMTEEVEEQKAIFRCIGYGGLEHIKDMEELKSYYGLQKECYNSVL